MTNDDFTIEEEYQIIDPATRELLSRAHLILATAQDSVGDSVQFEHYLSQIEIGTAIARSVPEVCSELTRLRREVIAAAGRNGGRMHTSVLALGGSIAFLSFVNSQLQDKSSQLLVLSSVDRRFTSRTSDPFVESPSHRG